MTSRARRWGFRARITALIAMVFVGGGVALLGVQYLLVGRLFDTAISTLTGCVDDSGVTVVTGAPPPTGLGCASLPAQAAIDVDTAEQTVAVLVQQSTLLSQEVLSGLLVWSVVTLLAFAMVAVVAASWLSRRSFARIGQITATTQRITRDDLHRRLDLPGPADEIKELGDTIDSMLDRLEMSFAQQERFIANASHELRTPLTTTRAALEIPLAQGRVPDHLLPAITRALDANRRSEQLIAALLRLARTAHRAEAPDHPGERTDLALVVADSRRRLGAEIEAAGLTVTTSTSAARVSGVDESLLALAVDNLVDNAIRHNDDRARMHIATGETGDRAWLEIANSGPHLTDTEAARLVEPFNRGPDTRTAPAGRSLGLGLTLVHDVTISLGGTVTLRPARDGGLIARIEFPSGE